MRQFRAAYGPVTITATDVARAGPHLNERDTCRPAPDSCFVGYGTTTTWATLFASAPTNWSTMFHVKRAELPASNAHDSSDGIDERPTIHPANPSCHGHFLAAALRSDQHFVQRTDGDDCIALGTRDTQQSRSGEFTVHRVLLIPPRGAA